MTELDRPIVRVDADVVEKRFPRRLASRWELEQGAYRWLAGRGYRHAPALLGADADADGCRLQLARVGIHRLTDALLGDDAPTRARRLEVLGRAIAGFHDLDLADCPVPGPTTPAELQAGWAASAEAVARAGTWSDPRTADHVRRAIDRAVATWVRTEALCLVHRDLRFDNVMVGDDPDQLWIIDWEMSTRSVAAHDLARFVWLELQDDLPSIRAFRRGYAADGRDLPEATDAPSPQTGFFRLLFAVEMLEYFTTRRTLDDGDRAYRAHLIDHVERVATAP